MARHVRVTDAQCWRCSAPVFYALVPSRPGVPRMEVMLDARPRADGPMWVDDNGFARDVVRFYLDGEARYTPHARTCPALGTADPGRAP